MSPFAFRSCSWRAATTCPILHWLDSITTVRLKDENPRGKVQNVGGDSAARNHSA